MKANKQYSNATFTKRVDHDGGRHRTPQAQAEPAFCSSCGAVYAGRRWTLANMLEKKGKRKDLHPANQVVCPACKQQQEGIACGFVYIDGDFLSAHREELERLLHNEADRAAMDNPLARIMGFTEDEKGRLTVTTTTEHLAKRLGQALEKAFDGNIRYDFSHENKLARVYWHRD